MLAFSTLAYSPFSPQAGPAANEVQEKRNKETFGACRVTTYSENQIQELFKEFQTLH